MEKGFKQYQSELLHNCLNAVHSLHRAITAAYAWQIGTKLLFQFPVELQILAAGDEGLRERKSLPSAKQISQINNNSFVTGKVHFD